MSRALGLRAYSEDCSEILQSYQVIEGLIFKTILNIY